MKRVLFSLLVLAGVALAADSARAQAVAAQPPAVRYVQAPAPAPAPVTYYYRNGYYYTTPPANAAAPAARNTIYYAAPAAGYSDHNGVLRGPSGAMTGRATHNFDPTGRGVQLYKPWLKPLR